MVYLSLLNNQPSLTGKASFILWNSLSVAQPESDMISHHSILYFENGMSFGYVGSTSCLFLLGFLLLGFLSAIVIVRVVYPVKHIKEIFFGHCIFSKWDSKTVRQGFLKNTKLFFLKCAKVPSCCLNPLLLLYTKGSSWDGVEPPPSSCPSCPSQLFVENLVFMRIVLNCGKNKTWFLPQNFALFSVF